MVTVCAKVRPSFQPRKPARMAPTRGANAAMQDRVKSVIFIRHPGRCNRSDGPGPNLSFQASKIIDVDRAQVPEERHQDREPDGRLGGGHGEDEEDEHLPREVVQEMGEGDEVHVHRQQHQLDRHQQHDQVLAVHEDADHADREEQRAEDQEMTEGNHGLGPSALPSDAIFTIRNRSDARTESCAYGSWYLVALRVRSVMAMAATMATSRITAASSKAKT